MLNIKSMQFNVNTKLSDIIFYDSSIISVINRFGIKLGVGDSSVKDIAKQYNIDDSFLITIINTFLNESYFPEKILKNFSIEKIIDYLQKTNSYYEQFQLPNIERHFNLLISKSDNSDGNLNLLMNFFLEMKRELIHRIDNDKNNWFPHLLMMSKNIQLEEIKPYKFVEISHPIEDKLNDLKSFFIVHLKGKYDLNLCHAVIVSIIALEKDLKQNNRIRERILRPIEHYLENTNIANAQ